MQPASRSGIVSAITCLDDPTRRTVYEYVGGTGGDVTRTETADALGIPRSTAAFHLERLTAEGLLTASFEHRGTRSGPGSGRTSKVYRLSTDELAISVPPRQYDLAAEIMASAIERSIATGENVADSLTDVAAREGAEAGSKHEDIGTLLEDTGYEPHECDGEYSFGNCPFHKLAAGHAGTVCSLNFAFLRGALDGANDTEHSIAPETGGAPCCARIVPAP